MPARTLYGNVRVRGQTMKSREAFLVAGAIALTDTVVKALIKEPPVKNYGFAGNRMDKHPGFVACVSTAVTGLVTGALAFGPDRMKLPLALVLGGAVSNTADRLIRGYVVDYIPFGSRYYGNISDISVFLGTGMASLLYLTDQEKEDPEHSPVSDDIVS